MANVIIAQRFWVRRDTAANWTSVNPTPADGEWCLETDTRRLKMGDGATAWNALGYSAAVADSITDGVTDVAPSQNAVFDALAGKETAGAAAAALASANTYTDDSISALGIITSGTWTPTLTNTTNVAASATAAGMYVRIGNVVTFAIRITAQATSGSAGTPVATLLEMSLPVPEDLVGVRELAGTAAIGEAPYVAGQVAANTTNDTANISWFATSTTNRVVTVNGAYEIT